MQSIGVKRIVKKYRIILYILVSLLNLFLMIHRVNQDDRLELRLEYTEVDKFEQECRLILQKGEELIEIAPQMPYEDSYASNWFEIYYSIPVSELDSDSLSVELLQTKANKSELRTVEIYWHNMQVAKYTPVEIAEKFTVSVENSEAGYNILEIIGNNEPIYLYGGRELLQIFRGYTGVNRPAYLNCAVYAVILLILLMGADYVCFHQKKYMADLKEKLKVRNWQDALYLVFLLTVLLITALGAFICMNYCHNDETITKMGIDYYLSHWKQPAPESAWMAGTHSTYGFARVLEDNLYYIVAGKIGWLFLEFFHISAYYRVLGVLCCTVLVAFCWMKRQENPWMAVAFLMSPQIWYCYAYATSDAWDWFWGFWLIYMLANKGSMLHSLLEGKLNGIHAALAVGFNGFILSQILQAKTNYLLVLAIALIYTLCFLIENRKNKNLKRQILAIVIIILLGTIFVKVKQNLPKNNDYVADMTTETGEKDETYEAWIGNKEDYHENQVIGDDSPRGEGLSFMETMKKAYLPTPVLLAISATGHYFIASSMAPKYYYFLLGVFYFLLFFIYMKEMLTASKNGNTVVSLCAVGSVLGVIAVALLYCWAVTFQPQGRYLLPGYLSFALGCSVNGSLMKNKSVKWIVLGSCFLSLYSYLFIYFARVLGELIRMHIFV